MDILSETRLYGLRSGTTADDRVRFCKNYSIDQDGLEHMDAECWCRERGVSNRLLID